jgi:hypothetical protein
LGKIFKWLLYTALALGLITILLIGSIDKTPLQERSFYQTMMKRLDTLTLSQSASSPVKIGWSKFNITPAYSMPMAGYTPKDKFESVHDSVFCRVLAIENDGSKNFIVSLDLMLFPPIIKERVNQKLKEQNKDYFIFYSATHTHSSLGGWDGSVVGRLALGTYQDKWIDFTVQNILIHIEKARESSISSTLAYWESDATEYVENRLDRESGKVDGKLRGLTFTRKDSTKGILTSYSGHPTNVDLLSRIISADYPATLTSHLEKNGYEFGMFLAGMVGSHRLKGFEGTDFERIEKAGDELSKKVMAAIPQNLGDSLPIKSAHIPIEFGSSQLRIANSLKVRDWAFSSLIGSLQGELTFLELGNIILLGTPCDFSGEVFVHEKLDSLAALKGKKLIITSFNGNYTGYITADQYYERGDEEEVMALNWVGPYFGAYYSAMIKKIIR